MATTSIASIASVASVTPTASNSIIDVQHLRTQFGHAVVHDNLNLQVQQGEILSIVGGSGSGKTVLMRQMLGLETPAQGNIRVFDEDIHAPSTNNLDFLRRRSGMLFQHGALYSALSVFDNVAQPMRELRTLSESLIADMVYLKLHMAGIGFEHAKKMPADLSGGMIKRIALARALALDPELLFLDEPTAGLDPDRSDSFVKLIQSLRQQLHLTVVMVTHDLDTLFALSSRIAVLAEKKVVTIGTPQEVVAFQHPFIQTFFLGGRGCRAMEVFTSPDVKDSSDHSHSKSNSGSVDDAHGKGVNT
ncbi:phospholipid/cholesterol/gamma-HCH transport system ATP-binding protein [Undibacterium sp. GrIS 1.8]|uniref:ABC transporter ATP-binding protein n=1 Tax=unclassified Undibacterium TaxID=2630295 RepID=UPI003398A37B